MFCSIVVTAELFLPHARLTGDNGDDGDTGAEDGEGDSNDVSATHLVTLIEPGDNTDTV